MALETDAATPIASLHAKLLPQHIWLWKRGAIEDHIGTTEKSETEWTKFQIAVTTNGFSGLCPDQQSVEEMIAWAAS